MEWDESGNPPPANDAVIQLREQYARDFAAWAMTPEKVASIRRRHASGGISQTQLAREHGVTRQAISSIIRRKTWKHVP